MKIDELTQRVIRCAFLVHKELRAGFLEKVCGNSLRIALNEAHISVRQQCPIPVIFHGQVVGDFVADLMIEDRLIVELKSVQRLSKEHEVQ
jgi:GxxExxY protein